MGSALLLLLLGAAAGWAWERRHRKTRAMPGGYAADISIPHEQEWELWHNDLSLCSKKTRMCLSELQIPYRAHAIDLIETGSYENIGRRYLAVHPGGLLPLLVHHGHPIYESHEQIRYAADHAPASAPKLVPGDDAQREAMQRWVDRASLTGDDPLAAGEASAGNCVPGLTVPLFAAMIQQIPYWRIAEGLLFHRIKSRPLIFTALKLRGFAGLKAGPAAKIIARSRRQMRTHLDALEQQLAASGGPWILGEAFSLADLGWAVVLERLREGDSLHVFVGSGKRPEVTAYWERLQKRASFQEAIQGFQHPTVVRGIQALRAAKAADPGLRAALEGSESTS